MVVTASHALVKHSAGLRMKRGATVCLPPQTPYDARIKG